MRQRIERLEPWRLCARKTTSISTSAEQRTVDYRKQGIHFLLSACWSVLGQDIEPQTAPDGWLASWWHKPCKALWRETLYKCRHLLFLPCSSGTLWSLSDSCAPDLQAKTKICQACGQDCGNIRAAKKSYQKKKNISVKKPALWRRINWLTTWMWFTVGLIRPHSRPHPLRLGDHTVCWLCQRQKIGKAPGPNGVSPSCLKACVDQLAPIFTQIFKRSLELYPLLLQMLSYRPGPQETLHHRVKWLALTHLKDITGPLLDPLQYVYIQTVGTYCHSHLLHVCKVTCHNNHSRHCMLLFIAAIDIYTFY